MGNERVARTVKRCRASHDAEGWVTHTSPQMWNFDGTAVYMLVMSKKNFLRVLLSHDVVGSIYNDYMNVFREYYGGFLAVCNYNLRIFFLAFGSF